MVVPPNSTPTRLAYSHEGYIPRFIEWQRSTRSAKTAATDEGRMLLFLRWLRVEGRSLDIRDLDFLLAAAYQRHLQTTSYTRHFGGVAGKRSQTTVQDYLRTLKTYSSYLFKIERDADGKPLTTRNLLAAYPLPEGEDPEKETLKHPEIERLLTSFNRKTATGLRNFAICLLFLETAMRSGELLRLEWQDLRWGHTLEERYIRLRPQHVKHNKNRLLPYPMSVRAALEAWREQRFYPGLPQVFSDIHGRPMTANALVSMPN